MSLVPSVAVQRAANCCSRGSASVGVGRSNSASAWLKCSSIVRGHTAKLGLGVVAERFRLLPLCHSLSQPHLAWGLQGPSGPSHCRPLPIKRICQDCPVAPCQRACLLRAGLCAGSRTPGHSLQLVQALRHVLHDPLHILGEPLVQWYVMTRCEWRSPLAPLQSVAMMPLPHIDTVLRQLAVADQLARPGPRSGELWRLLLGAMGASPKEIASSGPSSGVAETT